MVSAMSQGFSRSCFSHKLLTITKSTKRKTMGKIRSEVSGSVWQVEVVVGQQVNEGDTLVVVESMKMEIPVTAPSAGTVTEILVAEGEAVVDDQVILILG
jgi:biotin carboxyl carrier protein